MVKKELGPEDWWAQYIVRTESGGKEKIYALARRRYAPDDIETKGPGTFLGIKEVDRFEMIRDTDPDSDTYGKRIPNPSGEPSGKKQEYTYDFNDKNIKDFKQMVASIGTPFGQTRFTYKFKERTINCINEDEFWSIPWNEAYERYILGKQVIELKQPNINNSKSRRSK